MNGNVHVQYQTHQALKDYDIRFVKTDNDACNHETQTVKPYTDVYQAGQCNDHMERRQSNPIQMFIKLGSAMIHGTPSVKPYTDVYQAGQCNDPEKHLKEILQGLQLTHSSLYCTKRYHGIR